MIEQWRDVVGYEGYYQISNLGHVKRIHAITCAKVGHILKPDIAHNGYLRVTLCKFNKPKKFPIHHLVLIAFVGPQPSPVHQCNHANGDRADNRLENLSWVTPSENQQHSFKVLGRRSSGPKGERCALSKLTTKQVIEIRRLHASGKLTALELASMFHVARRTIYGIVNRKRWKHIS